MSTAESKDESMCGGCHCGAVRFTIQFARDANGLIPVHECNCSMCSKRGFLHMIVPGGAFTSPQVSHTADGDLVTDPVLSRYSFNTHTAQHMHCSVCGITPFYVPRSNPDGWSVNARCLDVFASGLDKGALAVELIDGQNWEEGVGDSLAHLSSAASL